MTLIVNGQAQEFPGASLPLPQLLEILGIDYPILVELNGTALHRWEWPDRETSEGDRIEIFRMVAGG